MINEEQLLKRIVDLGGFQGVSEASLALSATVSALSERIRAEERGPIARDLPPELSETFRARKYRRAFGLADFFNRVRRRENVSLGFAREHAEVVCRALGEAFSDETHHALQGILPEPFVELFHAPTWGEAPEHRLAHTRRHHTLATGAPGSTSPISASQTPTAQTHSVARETNPHADTKLSSSEGLTQERLDESLATALPDDRRTIGRATD